MKTYYAKQKIEHHIGLLKKEKNELIEAWYNARNRSSILEQAHHALCMRDLPHTTIYYASDYTIHSTEHSA